MVDDPAGEGDIASACSRRKFLTATASSAAAPLLARSLGAETAYAQKPATNPRDPVRFTLAVNGRDHWRSTSAPPCSTHCASISP
jgi:hypothetical protein